MTRRALTVWLAAAAAAAALVSHGAPGPARAAPPDPPQKRLPFSDDQPPPPALPEPLDRRFHAALTSFDGDRVGFRWSWTSDAELDDFEPFVPVRVTVRGGFERKDGAVHGSGTGGLRLRLGMLSDMKVGVEATLGDPHDLGVVLAGQGTSDESILCLVQDRFFTKFDAAAGNTNMINKLGGVADKDRVGPIGMVEFRYVARSLPPKFVAGQKVRFDVVRKGVETTCTMTTKGESPLVLRGKDPDAVMSRFQAGVYVAGSSATFGPLEIEGRIDAAWCQENGVLPFVAKDLLHPGNRFKGAERKAAELVETFVKQAAAATPPEPKAAVAPTSLATLVGDAKLPLVIRMRAAEALADSGGTEGGVAANIAVLLDAADVETRVLAWRVLRPRLPWHFKYEPDADPAVRRDATILIGAYFREEGDATAQGKVFIEGYWYTPSRADQIRGVWDRAWDLRTPHVRLRTNMTKEWADWTLAALEAEYREIVRVVGREPPAERLPLSVLLFATTDEYRAFCGENGYEQKAAWPRFADLDRLVAFDTFDKQTMPAWPMNLLAKMQVRATTGLSWPTWFEEGRASWFANGDYRTAKWDGKVLQVGLAGQGVSIRQVALAATQGKLSTVAEFMAKDPRTEQGDERRLWYAYAWALHAFLMDGGPEQDRTRFAEWQSTMEALKSSPIDVNAMGLRVFKAMFAKDMEAFDGRFREWLKTL